MSETSRPLPEWYRDWFGEEYLALYPHRDEEEAELAVDLVLRTTGRPEGLVLDLACGAGRHLTEFADRGVTVVGLDLSGPLLEEARERGARRLVRGDMRHLPFADGRFELVANFFTSFGYFAQPEEDRRVLAEIRRVLRRGGAFALDFLNADRVRGQLIPQDERALGDRRIVQRRRLNEGGEVVIKEIRIYEQGDAEPARTFYERVRLYSPEQLFAMLKSSGLEPTGSFGDYSGSPRTAKSPRCIILGQAT